MKIPGPSTGYTDLMDEALLQREAARPNTYYPLRPSASGYCSRQLAYGLMEFKGYASYEKEIKKPSVLRLLNLGNSVEWHSISNFELIKQVEPGTEIKYKQQSVTLFRLDSGKLIEGSIDLAVVGTNYRGIGDVKSKKDGWSGSFKSQWDNALYGFGRMKTLHAISDTSWYAPDLQAFLEELNDPFFAHNFVQVNSYLNSDFCKERGFDHGFIYRYCKNDSRHLEIRFAPSPELFEAVKKKFNVVEKAVENQAPEEAPQDHMLGSMPCAYCRFASNCWNGENALKAWYATLPPKEWPVDTNRLAEFSAIETIYEMYVEASEQSERKAVHEASLIELLSKASAPKIRFKDGAIFELKYLKSPRPHFELRKSKV